MRVLITGASGSGTSTMGRALASELGFTFIDADDYYWLQTDPAFQKKRAPAERLSRLLGDLQATSSAIVSGSIMEWGAELENAFSLVVFLTLDADIRVSRLRSREIARFGKADPEFLEWAAQYEEGRLPGRNRMRHEKWLSARSCSVLRLDGNLSVLERVSRACEALSAVSPSAGGDD